jgi:MFS family permease
MPRGAQNALKRLLSKGQRRFRSRVWPYLKLSDDDLLRDPVYRRQWLTILTGAFAGQVMMLALPLTAAVLLHASPTQMGLLTAMELTPFVLLSLPAGVWLDRVPKLPVYVAGEILIALAAASVPLAWHLGLLSMRWLYGVALVLGAVHTVAGSAAQIVLTQVVGRGRLVQAHAKNALANSGAEVIGPALAGFLIKVLGAPIALLANALLLCWGAFILRGLPLHEQAKRATQRGFLAELWAGLRFVAGHRLLVTLAALMGIWQMLHYAALTVQILFATRILGLTEQSLGFCYMGMGLGTIIGSILGHRLSERFGPGPCLVLGYAMTGVGWCILALAPTGLGGVAAFAGMLICFAVGALFIFINFLALRQAVTPEPMLGRMTSTMRWLTLLAAGPGALIGGWLGEHLSLRATLGVVAGFSGFLVVLACCLPAVRGLKALPRLPVDDSLPHLEPSGASVRPARLESTGFQSAH